MRLLIFIKTAAGESHVSFFDTDSVMLVLKKPRINSIQLKDNCGLALVLSKKKSHLTRGGDHLDETANHLMSNQFKFPNTSKTSDEFQNDQEVSQSVPVRSLHTHGQMGQVNE